MLTIPASKIAGVVYTEAEDESCGFSKRSPLTDHIGHNVAHFLASELRNGRIPRHFLPLQSGLGDTGNAVLLALADNEDVPDFTMFTEVIQDAALELLESGRCEFASASALALSPPTMRRFFSEIESMRARIVLRPQEISNHPELIRRLGVISVNTAIEVDLLGNVNSTHVAGQQLVNGIGGSGDFTRNAYLSIFCCPSTRLGGKISTIVPKVTHVDHSEHSVQVVVTEYGVADLRGRDPNERARLLITNCAHPEYREKLFEYCQLTKAGRTPVSLSIPFAMHQQFAAEGDMRPVRWTDWEPKGEKQEEMTRIAGV
jgi:acetyl-CoA hydrolase